MVRRCAVGVMDAKLHCWWMQSVIVQMEEMQASYLLWNRSKGASEVLEARSHDYSRLSHGGHVLINVSKPNLSRRHRGEMSILFAGMLSIPSKRLDIDGSEHLRCSSAGGDKGSWGDVLWLLFTVEKYDVVADVEIGPGFSRYSSYLRTEPDKLGAGLRCGWDVLRDCSLHSVETRLATFMTSKCPDICF